MVTFLLQKEAKWYRVGFFAIAFMVIPVFLQYLFVLIMPATYWFEYEKTEVIGVSKDMSYIEVLSFSEIKRPVKLEWNDVLYCRHSIGGYEVTTSYNSSKQFTQPSKNPRVNINEETGAEEYIPWRFPTQGRLQRGDFCYLESTITAYVREQEKVQKVTSNSFLIQ